MKTGNGAHSHAPAEDKAQEKAPGQGIWSGTVSFSLVAIPVRLVKAVEPGRVSLHMLHNKEYSPLERKMVCPEEGIIVPADEIVRGYEIEPGKQVMITDEELESVSPERSRTIEIAEFVDQGDVDPLYFDHPYFLVPLKGGEKSYGLLAEAMRRTSKVGIAKFVLDEREYLVAVKSRDGALELCTLHYSDEILPFSVVVPEKVIIDEKETHEIKNAIRKMMTDFNPDKYSDERRKRLLDIVVKKAKKNAVEAPEIDEESAEGMTDLMAALEKSMRKVKHRQ